jgi:hypothetical protein
VSSPLQQKIGTTETLNFMNINISYYIVHKYSGIWRELSTTVPDFNIGTWNWIDLFGGAERKF